VGAVLTFIVANFIVGFWTVKARHFTSIVAYRADAAEAFMLTGGMLIVLGYLTARFLVK